MTTDLLTSRDLDRHLRYPRGRSVRLARRGLIPYIELPDGEIRFDATVIRQWLQGRTDCAISEDCKMVSA